MNEIKEDIEIEDIDTEEIAGTRIYETGFLLSPNLSEDEMRKSFSSFESLITSKGGEIISSELPKFRDLAYPIIRNIDGKNQTFKSAYFGWIKFEASVDILIAVKAFLEGDNNVIRFIFIKTVREDTYVPRETVSLEGGEDEESVAEDDSSEDMEEEEIDDTEESEEKINVEEEIDKSIDDLISE